MAVHTTLISNQYNGFKFPDFFLPCDAADVTPAMLNVLCGGGCDVYAVDDTNTKAQTALVTDPVAMLSLKIVQTSDGTDIGSTVMTTYINILVDATIATIQDDVVNAIKTKTVNGVKADRVTTTFVIV